MRAVTQATSSIARRIDKNENFWGRKAVELYSTANNFPKLSYLATCNWGKNRSKCKNNVLSIFEQEIKNSQPLTAVLMRSSLLSDSAVICPTNTKTADWEGKRHGEELKRNRWPKGKENDDKETKRTKTFYTINQRNAEVRLAALASAITRSERVLGEGDVGGY